MSSNNVEIAVWGLKLGHQIFFSSNGLNAASAEVTDVLEDIRGVVNFSTPGIAFHSVELSEKYQIFSVYRTIYDWVGREGYFAISLFVPNGRELPPGRCYALLQELLTLYERNYIDDRNKIVNYKEDVTLFTRILDEKGKLQIASSGSVVGSGNRYAQVRYTSNSDLIAYLDSPCRSEYAEFKEIFFINETDNRLRLSPNVVLLNTPPVVLTMKFTVRANDGSSVTNIRPAILSYKCNGQLVQPQIGPDGLQATIGNLKPGDKISAYQKLDAAMEEIGSVVFGNDTSAVTTFEVKKTAVRLQISMDSDRADAYPFRIMFYGGGTNAGQYSQALVKNPVAGIIDFTMTLGHTFELTCDKIPNFNFKNSPNVAGFNHGNGTVNINVRVPGAYQTPVAGQASAYTASQQMPNRSYPSYQDRNTTKAPVSGKVMNGSKTLNNTQLKVGIIVILFLVSILILFKIFSSGDHAETNKNPYQERTRAIEAKLNAKKIEIDSLSTYLRDLKRDTSQLSITLREKLQDVAEKLEFINQFNNNMEIYDLNTMKPNIEADISQVIKNMVSIKSVINVYDDREIIAKYELLIKFGRLVTDRNKVLNNPNSNVDKIEDKNKEYNEKYDSFQLALTKYLSAKQKDQCKPK